MATTININELLLRWQELREQGSSISAEELCADCPDLLAELQRQIGALQSMQQFLGNSMRYASDALTPASAAPRSTTIPPESGSGAEPVSNLDLRGYELLERLGGGGMGDVFRAGDPALGRDLAVKVMKPQLLGLASAERRFLREARVTGLLQHPSIVPVYNLGRLTDGRLHYTMRLVQGDTFAHILQDKAGQPEQTPVLLSIFERVCQAVAYAHSKRVIHRDLKPTNIMVGRFGEVQVMDWGLAKVLSAEDKPASPDTTVDDADTRLPTESLAAEPDLTRPGREMGTPAYMPPEQARGEWESVDERADVFGLGAILCQILTGRAAYIGSDVREMLQKAKRGDLTDALARLDGCGADAVLVALCRECLAFEWEDRPRDAEAVAKRVADYQAAVQERLRQAELERVAAETRAREEQARAVVEQERTREALARVAAEEERAREAKERAKAERRAKRRALALAAAVMVLIVGAGGAVWWEQLKQVRANGEALDTLERGHLLLREGWRTNNVPKLTEALAEAERAAAIARNGGASNTVQQQVDGLYIDVQERLERAVDNKKLLDALVDIATPNETHSFQGTEAGRMMVLPERSVDEQYTAAFRSRWPDVDVDSQPTSTVAARLQEEPDVVVQGVIAGLDAWMFERRHQRSPQSEWRRLLELVEQLDAGESRRQLRRFLTGSVPPPTATVAGLLAGPLSYLALWDLQRGYYWRLLRPLRGQMDLAKEPVRTVLLLALVSSAVGDARGAEEVLRMALSWRPDEVALLNALGKELERQGRWEEAIGCYRSARAKNPELGVTLAQTLIRAGHAAEGTEILHNLIHRQPKNPEMIYLLGNALLQQRKPAEAAAAYRKVIGLKSDSDSAHSNLGNALKDQNDLDGAIECWRKAVALGSKSAQPYYNLGAALQSKGDLDGAIAYCKKAIEIDANDPKAHNNLGLALFRKRDFDGAIACYKQAIVLDINYAYAHNGLGIALHGKGDVEGAIECYRKALIFDPTNATILTNLGDALRDKNHDLPAAIACFEKALAYDPNYAQAHNGLGVALHQLHKLDEAIASYRRALALDPIAPRAHHNLAIALYDKGDLDNAIAHCKKSIELKQNVVAAHMTLANALVAKKEFREAEVVFNMTIALKPTYADAYYGLGIVLNSQGKLAKAEQAYRKAIECNPDYAEAHCNLGSVLRNQGHFRESLSEYRKGHELGSKRPGWPYPSPHWVRTLERMVEMENNLPAVLRGEALPVNNVETLFFAQVCQHYKKRYVAAARLYADAFVADPSLASKPNQQLRYQAACSAALAAARQGEDAHSLPDKAAVMFRHWSLSWLRDDLSAYTKLSERNNPTANQAIQQQLTHWRRDPDLTSVRDAQSLDSLPERERAAWQSLWRGVDDLAKRGANNPKANETRKPENNTKEVPISDAAK